MNVSSALTLFNCLLYKEGGPACQSLPPAHEMHLSEEASGDASDTLTETLQSRMIEQTQEVALEESEQRPTQFYTEVHALKTRHLAKAQPESINQYEEQPTRPKPIYKPEFAKGVEQGRRE